MWETVGMRKARARTNLRVKLPWSVVEVEMGRMFAIRRRTKRKSKAGTEDIREVGAVRG